MSCESVAITHGTPSNSSKLQFVSSYSKFLQSSNTVIRKLTDSSQAHNSYSRRQEQLRKQQVAHSHTRLSVSSQGYARVCNACWSAGERKRIQSLVLVLPPSLDSSVGWRIVLRFSIPLPSPYHKPQPTTLLHEHERVHYQRTTSYNHIYVAPVVTHTQANASCNEVAKKRLRAHRNEMLFVVLYTQVASTRAEGGMKRDSETHKCNWKSLADIFIQFPVSVRDGSRAL